MKQVLIAIFLLTIATGAAAFDDGSPIAYDSSGYYGPYVAITPFYQEPNPVYTTGIPQELLHYDGQTGWWDVQRLYPNYYDTSILIQPGMPPAYIIDARMTPDTPVHDPALYDSWYHHYGRFPWAVNTQECPIQQYPDGPQLYFLTPGWEGPLYWSDGRYQYFGGPR